MDAEAEYLQLKRKYNELLQTSVAIHDEITKLKKQKLAWSQEKRFLLDRLNEWECALQPELLDETILPHKLRVLINGEEKTVAYRPYETLQVTLERLASALSFDLAETRVALANGNSVALDATLGELWRKNKLKEVRLSNSTYKPKVPTLPPNTSVTPNKTTISTPTSAPQMGGPLASTPTKIMNTVPGVSSMSVLGPKMPTNMTPYHTPLSMSTSNPTTLPKTTTTTNLTAMVSPSLTPINLMEKK